MIKTIIFDLAEVYLKGFYGIEYYLEGLLNLEPLEISEKLKGPEFKLFYSVQYSFEVGCCKSDKKSFVLMFKKLGENSEDCLFIDDNENNISVAKSVGLNVIQFENPEQLKKELFSFSIEI